MAFTTKKVHSLTLGERLRETRKSLKLSLGKASQKTGIPIKYLISLEDEYYENLPADVYVRGFLTKYAKLLNLDIDELLIQYKRETSFLNDLAKSPPGASFSFLKRPRFVITPKRAAFFIGAVIIVLLLGYFWHQLSFLLSPPKLSVDQPSEDMTVFDVSLEVLGKVEYDSYLTVNDQKVYIDKNGRFSAQILLHPGLNVLKVEAKSRFGKTNTIIRRVMYVTDK